MLVRVYFMNLITCAYLQEKYNTMYQALIKMRGYTVPIALTLYVKVFAYLF